jgi:hypothetical protein
MTNTNEFAMACGGFLDDALSGRLSHCSQRILDDAVASATKRDLAGGIAWDRARDGSIAPLVAATLAHFGLLQHGSAAVKKVSAAPMIAAAPESERTGHFFERADRAVDSQRRSDVRNAPKLLHRFGNRGWVLCISGGR